MNTAPQQIFHKEETNPEKKAPVFWQDKGASGAGRAASVQPAPPPGNTGAPKTHRLDKITARVKPEIRAELSRIARSGGISLSQAAAAFIERGVLGDIVMQTETILKPVIEETIRTELRAFANRFLAVIARIAYQVGFILVLLRKFIGIALRADEATFHRIEVESETAARVNVTRRTPQFDEMSDRLRSALEGGEG
jgi:hypothetical protein